MKIKLTGKEKFIGRFEVNKEPFRLTRGPQNLSNGIEKPAILTTTQPGPIPNLDHLLQLRLSELSKREIAIKIYSEILGCEVWLCSNERIALQIRFDDPEAITYTVAEMRQLIKLNPGSEDLKNIHNAKVVFPGSRIVDSKLKEDDDNLESNKPGGETDMGINIEAEKPIDPGVYDVKIAKVDAKEGKFGIRLQVTFELPDGRSVNGFFAPKATVNNKTGRLFEKVLGKLETVDSDELLGKTVKVLIETNHRDGTTYTNVSKIL